MKKEFEMSEIAHRNLSASARSKKAMIRSKASGTAKAVSEHAQKHPSVNEDVPEMRKHSSAPSVLDTKKIILSLLVLTILISVFGTLAVLDATKNAVKKIEPWAAAEQAAAKESAEQLSSTSTISFVVLERPEE